jgi:hypothetical protein
MPSSLFDSRASIMNPIRVSTSLLCGVAYWLVAIAGCNSARPGSFSGDYPDPLQINVPQTPEFAAAMAGANSEVYMYPLGHKLRSGRRWTTANTYSQFGAAGPSLPSSINTNPWPYLAHSMDSSNAELGYEDYGWDWGPLVLAATLEIRVASPINADSVLVAAGINHVLLISNQDQEIQPIGPSGPTLFLTRGYHHFRRTCTVDEPNRFEEVSLDTTIDMVSEGQRLKDSNLSILDDFVSNCGIAVNATVDLGDVAAPIPGGLPVRALAWTSGAETLYFLAGLFGAPYTPQINQLGIGESAATLVASGNFLAPLWVSTGGSSLIGGVSDVMSISGLLNGLYLPTHLVRFSLSGSTMSLQSQLDSYWPPHPPHSVLSPDGNTLFTHSYASTTLELQDMTTLSTLSLSSIEGEPLAWSPAGDALLFYTTDESTEPAHFATLSLDVTSTPPVRAGNVTVLPSDGIPNVLGKSLCPYCFQTGTRFFWTASGPQALIQDGDGARVYNFTTQQTAQLVEPTLVAPPFAPTDVVVATEQVFAWAMQCYGLAETSCKAELRRLSLKTGVIDVVANADQVRLFAVSSGGTKIAFADSTNIYIKSIAP